MALEFWFELCFYVFYCGISVMLENNLSFFYNIFGYVLLIETITYCTFSRFFKKNSTATPIVNSVITSNICQDGGTQPPSVALDTKPKLILEYKGKYLIPKVYSDSVFKICGALMIEVELSPMEKQQLDWEIKQNIEKEEPSCCSFCHRLQDLRCVKS
ncbi:hypothetical protein TNIN_133001 [Trichonephila inaurata madagascariensis]|uniref:Uncharacterized protein n=1 Tax=Trichonephila inaurata madagascariensis TaxID=2747483 RepID=A0A8X6XTD6_9ARAC|nr:hypothetical protein TNIN_133001 [Trichonephila inaurata madagascariensis]